MESAPSAWASPRAKSLSETGQQDGRFTADEDRPFLGKQNSARRIQAQQSSGTA